MPMSMQAGDVLAERYRLDDLLAETGAGRFWRAHDLVLHRPVAVHILAADDERAAAAPRGRPPRRAGHRPPAAAGARRRGRRRPLLRRQRVGPGRLPRHPAHPRGPARRRDVRPGSSAEVADSLAEAHAAGLAHGRLTPENVLIDQHGQVRIIGFGVEAALRGLPRGPGQRRRDRPRRPPLLRAHRQVGRRLAVGGAPAPEVHGEVLRPRRVRAGIPRMLDALCDQVLNPQPRVRPARLHRPRAASATCSTSYVGDMTGTHVAVQGTRPPPSRPPTASRPSASALATPPPTSAVAPTTVVPVVPAPTSSRMPTRRCPTLPTPTPGADRRPPGEPEPEVTTAVRAEEPPGRPGAVDTDLPTQAGMPVFHDDDEVDWLRARAEKPAPPPPLRRPGAQAALRARPAGGRARTPSPPGQPRRHATRRTGRGTPARTPAMDPNRDSGVRPVGRDTGSWCSGSWSEDRWGTGDGLDDTGDQVPGRTWIRLAMIVGICLLVGVAAVAAYQLGLKPPTPGSSEEPTSTDHPERRRADAVHRPHRRRLRPAGRGPAGGEPGLGAQRPRRRPDDLVVHLDLPAELRPRRAQDRRRSRHRPRHDQGRPPGAGHHRGWTDLAGGVRHLRAAHRRVRPDARRDRVRRRRADDRPRRSRCRAATSPSG